MDFVVVDGSGNGVMPFLGAIGSRVLPAPRFEPKTLLKEYSVHLYNDNLQCPVYLQKKL